MKIIIAAYICPWWRKSDWRHAFNWPPTKLFVA